MSGFSKRNAIFAATAASGLCVMVAGQTASAATIMGDDLSSFAVLGASTVTNVPTSTIRGNVGVSPGSSITGFDSSPGVATSDPQVTNGSVHATTALALSAQAQLTTARTSLDSLGVGTMLAADLAGLTLSPGVYTVPAGTTNLSGTLTLDGLGNPNAGWVFQMPSTLITSPSAVVSMVNAGAGAGLFWNVGSSATLDVNTTFLGNILASASVTVNTTATILCGRALADTADVTLQMNSIFATECGDDLAGSNGLDGGFIVTDDGTVIPAPIPLPASALLLFGAIGGLGAVSRRRRAA